MEPDDTRLRALKLAEALAQAVAARPKPEADRSGDPFEAMGRLGALLSLAFPGADHPAMLDWATAFFALQKLSKTERSIRLALGDLIAETERCDLLGSDEPVMVAARAALSGTDISKGRQEEINLPERSPLRAKLEAIKAAAPTIREALSEAHSLNVNVFATAEPETLAYYSEHKAVIAMGAEALKALDALEIT